MLKHVKLFTHSAIRIRGSQPSVTIYFDPFKLADADHDADLIFITHEHFDHFSPEDIEKAAKYNTLLICPESMRETAEEKSGIPYTNIITMKPDEIRYIGGVSVVAIPAYNLGKPFHPQKNGWLGYVVTIDDKEIYVTGDTDCNEDNFDVPCDILFVPVGGTYTFNPEEAAVFTNRIHPEAVVPTHYGSVAGDPDDGIRFAKLVDEDIEVYELKQY